MAAGVDFYRQPDYWANGLTHFFIDFLNSGRNLVMAVLAVTLGLSNAQVGLALLIYNVGSALLQPLFGLLTDRVGARWLVVGGLAWMILFSALTAFAGDWTALVTLTLAGIGSGAFHPAGATVATRHAYRRRSRATALFFAFGTSGLFVGPVFAGFALDRWARPGYALLPFLAVTALALSLLAMPAQREDVSEETAPAGHRPVARSRSRWLPLMALIVCYSTVAATITSYLPKLFLELNLELQLAGTLISIYLLGVALGNLLGGALADRLGSGKPVIILGMGLSVLPLYLGLSTTGDWQKVLLLAAGVAAAMPHSVLVLYVQSLFPRRRGLASGLVLGGMFFSGSIGSYLYGVMGDYIGLAAALQSVALMPLAAFALGWLLPADSASTPAPVAGD